MSAIQQSPRHATPPRLPRSHAKFHSRAITSFVCAGLLGCGTPGYLMHLAAGQLGVLRDRQLLTEERITQLKPHERENLERLRVARRWGAKIGLESSTSFRHLLDRGPEQSVRVLVAAPVDALTPVTWSFPVVGRISYRGYFDPERANAFATGLHKQGFDTYVRAAPIYSTLGWFDDPIPRAILGWNEVALIETTLHELVHETIFVPSKPDYNEALATFLSQQATLLFFEAQPELRSRALSTFADHERYRVLLNDLATELERAYDYTNSREEALHARSTVFEHFQKEIFPQLGWETLHYQRFPELELSNAFIVAHRTYVGQLDCFRSWLAQLSGDLKLFIEIQKSGNSKPPNNLPECSDE